MSDRHPPKEQPHDGAIIATPVLKRLSDVTPRPVEWLWAGRFAIGKLTLRQAPLRRVVPKAPPPPPDPAVAARIAESLPQIEDEALRQAIARLGAAIKRK